MVPEQYDFDDFQLDWKPNFQFAGLIYAQQSGWYSKAGATSG